jgi:diguanylate cyclase (GGDEF)-like protein
MKILIADDDPTIRTILQTALVRLGYRVEIAGDGDQAWSLLQQPQAPELAILDWKMPGITGIEICQRLRQRKDAPYVYVVLLTGLDTLNDLVAGLEAGADDYMTKPFKPAELNARLRSGRRVLDLQRELLAAQAQLSVLANHDSLTDLWNRRVIIEKLDQELARAERETNSVGVVLVDIDDFKSINDSLGHSAGDEALQQVAKRLTEVVRPYDSVGRYGGEEFLIVAANCNLYETFKLAERAPDHLSSANNHVR